MRLPGAVSRLAAPFFGSQAEPFSRRRWRCRAVGGVCLAFGVILLLVRRCLPVHGVILSFALCGSVHPSLRIIAGAGLHLFLDSVFYVAVFC